VELSEFLADSLLSRSSVAVELFGVAGVEALLKRHAECRDQLQVLGFLVTAEAFRQQALRLAKPLR
jgi:hypothetical protein